MINPEQSVEKDIKTFISDVRVHFIYTLVIVALASVATYFLINAKLDKEFRKIVNQDVLRQQATTVILPPQAGDSQYIESTSPYANRSLSDATPSANVIFHGPRDKKKIALTFDAEMTDGMRAAVESGIVKQSYDQRIFDILNQTHTNATFFLTGMWIELYPDLTRKLANNPLFELGSHSYSDTSYYGFCYGLGQLKSTVKIEQVGAAEKLLREYAGIENNLFRFPGGCFTPDDVKLVNDAGDTVVHWDITGSDGFNNNPNLIVKNITDNVQNGSIIILHLNGAPTAPKTAEALPIIISTLKSRGYQFVKVSDLLGLQPPAKSSNY